MATDLDFMADVVVSTIQRAIDPILLDIKSLQSVVANVDLRWNDLGALRERVAVLETRAPMPGPPGPKGDPGEKGDRGFGHDGQDGKDGAPGLNGKDGRDGIDGKDGAPGLNGKDGAPGLAGKDGRDGLNGKDGAAGLNGKDGAPGLNGKDGSPGLDGTDGDNVVEALVDRAGHLVLTLSSGRTKDVGPVVGKDGAAGLNGKDGAPGVNGKDGSPGYDGKHGEPGLSPDDFDWSFEPETRSLSIKLFRNGTVVAERTKALTGMRVYRGVYKAGAIYQEGDVVSWDGSEWTAMAATSDRPGNGATPWKLTVKHGEAGKRGPDGKPGRDGRDLTQMDATGRKWGQ